MSFKVKDHYYKKAKKENFLARSIYKLEEIDKKYKIIKKGQFVLDLGYYPGSWIQYISNKVGPKGSAIGIDIQEVNPKLEAVPNVKVYQEDAFDLKSDSEILGRGVFDVICSDMAPKTTGIKTVDQERSFQLVEKVFSILETNLKENGNLVVKIFDGPSIPEFIKTKRKTFAKIEILRPKSTRSTSKEFFLIGIGFKKHEKK